MEFRIHEIFKSSLKPKKKNCFPLQFGALTVLGNERWSNLRTATCRSSSDGIQIMRQTYLFIGFSTTSFLLGRSNSRWSQPYKCILCASASLQWKRLFLEFLEHRQYNYSYTQLSLHCVRKRKWLFRGLFLSLQLVDALSGSWGWRGRYAFFSLSASVLPLGCQPLPALNITHQLNGH